MTLKLLIVYFIAMENVFLFYVFFIMSLTDKTKSTLVPDMTPFEKDMTVDLITSFSNETEDFQPTSVESIMNTTRKQFFQGWFFGAFKEKLVTCYMTTVTYKAAMFDLRRYFEIRTLYLNTLEFEIGYLTHEIIYRYQLILELYHIVEKRFMFKENKNFSPSNYMFYMYTNILVHSKAIFHLCNMIHEIERKYVRGKQKKGVFDDYGSGSGKFNKTIILDMEAEIKKYLQRQRKEAKKKAKEQKKYYKEMQKFGTTTAKKWKPPKKGPFPLIYGWSLENWGEEE